MVQNKLDEFKNSIEKLQKELKEIGQGGLIWGVIAETVNNTNLPDREKQFIAISILSKLSIKLEA